MESTDLSIPGTSRQRNQSVQMIDWAKCCLCQTVTDEKLRVPASSSYESLSHRLLKLKEYDAIPPKFYDLACFDNGQGIQKTMEVKKAVWHKDCYTLCNQQKVDRAMKRKSTDASDETTPVKKRLRKSIDPSTLTTSKCFFCDQCYGKLHEVWTMQVHENVKAIATKTLDTRILAKLAAGDMTARDAVYHSTCLCEYYRKDKQQNDSCDTGNTYEKNTSTAFAELISYIENYENVHEGDPVFKLSDLVKLYTNRLEELGCEIDFRINSSHLKDKILSSIPSLQECKSGRNIVLSFDTHIGKSLLRMSQSRNDMVTLLRAATIVRNEILSSSYKFSGSLNDSNYRKLPATLSSLIDMILSGRDISQETESESDVSAACISITELIVFNSVKRHRKDRSTTVIKHNPERETSLPLYLGIMVHAKTRKQELVDILFDRGLSVSYRRVLEVSEDIAAAVLSYYEETGIVCPPYLKHGLYTTGNLDNIDHNPTSLTSTESFHGTAISVTQHLMDPAQDGTCSTLNMEVDKTYEMTIPERYTEVRPITMKTNTPQPPQNGTLPDINSTQTENAKQTQDEWLMHVSECYKNPTHSKDNYVSWAAFFAAKQTLDSRPPAITAMLPLFRDNAHSAAMIKHGMNVVRDIITLKNPGQTPVITLDQPLYTLAKKIQWLWPEDLGEQKYVVMMGGLHIEMAFLKVIGDWLEESGWISALTAANIITPGRADNVQKGGNVGRGQWIHQVMAATLHILKQKAYEIYLETSASIVGPAMSFDIWIRVCSTQYPQFKFWEQCLQMELLLLRFLQAQRQADFKLYVETLRDMLPWLFVLDHIHYARWMSIHLIDLEKLQLTNPSTYNAFSDGAFVTQKSRRKFSTIAHDQVHEQQNAILKGEGGIIGITEMMTTLQRYSVSAPEITRILTEVGTQSTSENTDHHHQGVSTQKRFIQNVKNLTEEMENLGNPFLEDTEDLIALDSKVIVYRKGTDFMMTAQSTGKEQFDKFLKTNLLDQTTSLYEPLTKNNIQPFKRKSNRKTTKTAKKLASLKTDVNLFSRMYIACQNRDGDLDNFFAHENKAWPPSLADGDDMKTSNKSDLLEPLEKCYEKSDSKPGFTCRIIDGAAAVQSLDPNKAPVKVKDFKAYAEKVFVPYIVKLSNDVERVDIVWDRYFDASLKESTRQHRGSGESIKVTETTSIPRVWHTFLRNDSNKKSLYEYLSKKISEHKYPLGKTVVTTLDDSILVSPVESSDTIDFSDLYPCNHEEADYRMFLHATHNFKNNHQSILIQATDTDVVVLGVALASVFPNHCLWIGFGHGKDFRYIPCHKIAMKLGQTTSWGLLLLHALSGCDTVSFFGGIGKKTAFSVWMSLPELHDLFKALSSSPTCLTDTDIKHIERFVVLLYNRTSEFQNVNEARKHMFAYGNKQIDKIPPSHCALVQHILRAVYQSGHIWGQMVLKEPKLPSPTDWGWTQTEDRKWKPLWSKLPEASKICNELIRCNCKKKCAGRCKCIQANLSCTQLCYCQGNCERED